MSQAVTAASPLLSGYEKQTPIIISLSDREQADHYASAIRATGFLNVSIAKQAIDEIKFPTHRPYPLLICELEKDTQDDALDQLAIRGRLWPTVSTIGITSHTDPQWTLDCIRAGAVDCHYPQNAVARLVELTLQTVRNHSTGKSEIAKIDQRILNGQVAEKRRRLREAVKTGDIDVVFQPIIDNQSGQPSRMEALSRWNDPVFGTISPDEFIGLAEEDRLIHPLCENTLRKGLLALKTLRENGYHLKCSINVSRGQFDEPHLVQRLLAIVTELEESPSSVTIEITETTGYPNPQLATKLIQEFADAGFELALDDFGTGQSTFQQLSTNLFQELKLDRSLVNSIDTPAGDAVVASIASLAKELELVIVAEGIEDQATLDRIKQLKVEFSQGYLFARPMPLEKLLKFLDQNSQSPLLQGDKKGGLS